MVDCNSIETDFKAAIDLLRATESTAEETLEFRILIALYWLEHFVCCLNASDQTSGPDRHVISLIEKISEVEKRQQN